LSSAAAPLAQLFLPNAPLAMIDPRIEFRGMERDGETIGGVAR
jgi:hypothetical protein